MVCLLSLYHFTVYASYIMIRNTCKSITVTENVMEKQQQLVFSSDRYMDGNSEDFQHCTGRNRHESQSSEGK